MMKMNHKELKKGDGITNRLFSFLTYVGMIVTHLTPLKDHVFLVETRDKRFILKGYVTFDKMWKQVLISEELKKTGFTLTSYVRLFPNGNIYEQFLSKYWLLYDALEEKEAFTFERKENRKLALKTLHLYHLYARKLPKKLCGVVPNLSLQRKMWARLHTLYVHRSTISFYVGESVQKQVLDWSYFTLSSGLSLKSVLHSFLHGDVIHHNFLKSTDVYLIDFDCMSFGPVYYDYMKWCHCVLPFEDWSFESLFEYDELKWLLHDSVFLRFLVFPEDLLREWYYFLKLPACQKPYYEERFIDFTKKQFLYRLQFVERIYNMIT